MVDWIEKNLMCVGRRLFPLGDEEQAEFVKLYVEAPPEKREEFRKAVISTLVDSPCRAKPLGPLGIIPGSSQTE